MLVWTVRTQRNAIKMERSRLDKLVHERTVLKQNNGFLPEWIPSWLKKTNEEYLKTDECKKECSNCGRLVDVWIETEFSFCNEYGCGISFCKDCATELASEFNQKFK